MGTLVCFPRVCVGNRQPEEHLGWQGGRGPDTENDQPRKKRNDGDHTVVSGICIRALALAVAVSACVGRVGATPLEQDGGAPFGVGSGEHGSYESSDVRVDAAPGLSQGATAVDAEAPLADTGSSGALVINATFDSSITNDPNSAAIQAMINNAISIYQSLFNDPMTVSILFRYSTTAADGTPLPSGNLARSNFVIYSVPWNTYINALTADATTANDATANASLPASALSTKIIPSSAGGRAVGLNTPPAMFADSSVGVGGPYDGIVTLNANQPFRFTRPPTAGIYDALRSTEHEIDEVLGLGSYISVLSDLRPQDLFSWSAAGVRNLTSSGSRYFSINGGVTNIVGFNQNPSGDFGDWLSGSCPQANPYAQNAFSCAGQASDVTQTSPEGINLDVVGYDLITGPGTHDSVVLSRQPLTVTLKSGVTSVTKNLIVTVRNADILPTPETPGHTILLTASSTDCPAGTIAGLPDFDAKTPGAQNSVRLAGGKSKSAALPLVITSSGFTTFNHKAQTRCTITLTASSPGNTDPVATNNVTTVEINVIDKNDPEQSTAHESVIQSISPVTVTLKDGMASTVKNVRPVIGNADILPAAEVPGHLITVTASDGDCPAGTVGIADYDGKTPGAQNSATVKGGATKGGPLPLTINASAFATTNAKSPARCTAVLTATGPSNPDPDPSNNTTKLVIDVIDKNDF